MARSRYDKRPRPPVLTGTAQVRRMVPSGTNGTMRSMDTQRNRRRTPKRHAAKRSRVAAGVLSAMAFLGLAGGMAARSGSAAFTAQTGTSSGSSSSGSSSSSDDSSSGPTSGGSTGWSAAPGSSGSGASSQPNSVSHAS
jgi:hypothetical protein